MGLIRSLMDVSTLTEGSASVAEKMDEMFEKVGAAIARAGLPLEGVDKAAKASGRATFRFKAGTRADDAAMVVDAALPNEFASYPRMKGSGVVIVDVQLER